MKNKNLFGWLFLLAGLLIMLYPLASYGLRYFQDITSVRRYSSGDLSEEQSQQLKNQIQQYNQAVQDGRFNSQIQELSSSQVNPDPHAVSYYDFLQTGEVLGTLTIPAIQEKLPIYYGTSENVLRVGLGLMENTSYPGTENGNSVITGHRGTYDANILRNVDKMAIGDVIYFQDKINLFKYSVYKIITVSPFEGGVIKLEPGRDVMTLVTCTPYLLNTHRLLIFAERTDFLPGEVESLITKDTTIVNHDFLRAPEIHGAVKAPEKTFLQQVRSLGWEMRVIIAVLALLLIALLVYLLIRIWKKKDK